MPSDTGSPRRQDLQSPQRRGYGKLTGLNNGDSPGDVEPSQDIFWDPTSPTPANGLRNNRVVEISDIVNRIAPKDVKRKGSDSPLLQWIGDSAVPCTPDVPRPRMRKRSSRQSSVEDLMKLARQFDANMQKDRETSEQLNTDNNNLSKCVNTSKTKLTETQHPTNVKELKCTPSLEQAEAELHALFDCSTQKVSGRLSQGSSVSACSQEVRKQPVTSASVEPKQSELKTSSKSAPAAKPAGEKGPCGFSDDFDDDWEDDELLNDSFVLEITQNPDQLLDNNPKTSLQSKTNTTKFTSVCNPPAPDHDDDKVCPVASSVRNIADSHWDDGDDDDLLIQICDSVERISNSQPEQVRPRCDQDKYDNGADRQRKNTAPLPIDTTWSTNTGISANRKSPFVRSNSLPGTSCHAVNHQGWDIPMKGANSKSEMSQSLPGSRMGRCTFSNCKNSSGTFQTGKASVDMKPHTVTVQASQNSKSHHTAFKRNLSDSAVMTNKVFVTSQMTAKCSAAEIERKKQEALARRRLRMQNSQKP
ncbi:uncharacterized protein [Labrus bergylta]|uniref:ETAA1 activator of ATR kinase n=1 Tax=Labrus bergylta TaxID=56723 RepID=A0A3Q3ETY5_9LABR|nr:ewing's tumor-associated antigen 1 [Labrus bergylta]